MDYEIKVLSAKVIESGYRGGGFITVGDGGNSRVHGEHEVTLLEAYNAVMANKAMILW